MPRFRTMKASSAPAPDKSTRRRSPPQAILRVPAARPPRAGSPLRALTDRTLIGASKRADPNADLLYPFDTESTKKVPAVQGESRSRAIEGHLAQSRIDAPIPPSTL